MSDQAAALKVYPEVPDLPVGVKIVLVHAPNGWTCRVERGCVARFSERCCDTWEQAIVDALARPERVVTLDGLRQLVEERRAVVVRQGGRPCPAAWALNQSAGCMDYMIERGIYVYEPAQRRRNTGPSGPGRGRT